MTNATGVAVAAAPSAGILVAGATPVAADGSVVVAGVARNAAFRLGANSGVWCRHDVDGAPIGDSSTSGRAHQPTERDADRHLKHIYARYIHYG
jgi:hypothetical protein